MNVCEKLKQLTVSLIALDIIAIECFFETSINKNDLIKLYQCSDKTIDDIAQEFFIDAETAQMWLYTSPKHRHGLKEPRRSQLVKYLKCDI